MLERASLWGAAALVALAGGAVLWWSTRAKAPEDPVAGAWVEVTRAPQDPAGWTRLGELQVQTDELDAAEHAFRTALALGDDSGVAYARLGFLLYGRGEDEEARALLTEAQRRGAEVPMLSATLAALAPPDPGAAEPPAALPLPPQRAPPPSDAGVSLDASAPEPALAPDLEPASDCAVPLRREGRGVYLVDVRAAGVEATLVLDTGASITVLTAEFVARAGLELDTRRVIRAITANGRVEMATAVVPEVELGGFVAEQTRVAVCTDCVEGLADGLLGLDLQARLQLELDLAAGEARLGGCQ